MIVGLGLVLLVLLLAIVNLRCSGLSHRRIRSLLHHGVLLFLAALAPVVLSGCAGLVSSASSTPPSTLNITNVQTASITTSGSQVVWLTNVPANSSVDYGTTTAYGFSTPVDSTMVTSHQVTLTGLAAGTTYYYQVNSIDSKGNHGHGGNKFNTAGYSLSGAITPTAAGNGATVALSGPASSSATADSSGNYTFAGLPNGAYTIVPNHAGFAFTPGSQSMAINGANVTGVNFTATAQTFSISGTISPVAGGSGATVTLSGSANATTTANSSGAYTLTGLTSGSYTITPSNVGYTFTPPTQNVTVSAANISGVNFTDSAVAIAPTITTAPGNQTVTAGQTATFTVVAAGTAPLSYQWQKNGANIAGATGASYTTPATATSDSGSTFDVVVSNTAGTATSAAATLTVSPTPVAPTVTTPPANQTVTAGQTATFTVVAAGTAPLSYQWQKNSAAIGGATSSTYTTPATATSDNGAQFTVVVSNAAGSATSSAATLTVNAAPTLQITTSQLPGGFVSGAYASTLTATGGSTPYTWNLASGALPNGLALNAAGTISGTPSVAGSFPFTVQVKDAAAQSASRNFFINVVLPVPTVAISSPTSGASLSGTVNVTGTASDTVSLTSVQVSVDNGTFSNASGTNNWSFSLNTSSLSNGPHTLTAEVTDVAGSTATSSSLAVTVSNGSLATDCTLYASSSGNDNNSGTSPTSPKTFIGAAFATQPGSVVCLLGGTYNLNSTFYPPTSGTPSSWIVYKNYGDGPVNFVWTAGAIAQSMFQFGNGTFPSNPAYLEFHDLNLDGQNNALNGFFCVGAHHLRFIGNTINNTGGSGVGAVQCDYLTSDHNLINHNGYLYGWTSGISYNNNVWFDSYPGFHNIIANNIVVGEFDGSSHHTDGNGIILDLGGNTPPALIINNVVYGNGGRCIQSLNNINFWIVNNTCYKNNLDTSLGNAGSFTSQDSSNGYFINNIAVAWHTNNPSYDQEGSNSNISYYADMYFGSSPNFAPADPSQLIQADPLFVNPPFFDPTALGQYATALAPSLLGNGLTLLPLSPAYNIGIDPSTLSGVPSAIVTDLKKYIYTDINGKARPQGGSSDLGAYQH